MGIEGQTVTNVMDEMVPAVECVIGLAGDIELFAGTTRGVYRSMDFGHTWLGGTTDQAGPSPVLALGISPQYGSDGTVFVGSVDGLWQSDDKATTWRHVLGGDTVNALVLVEGVGTYAVIAGTDKDGVLRSDDAGRNWHSANPGLLDLSVLSLVSVPGHDHGQVLLAGTASGLYRSANNGKSWRPVNLLEGTLAVQCLDVVGSRATTPTVLAGTEADGLFRSIDIGQSWEAVVDFGPIGVSAIAGLPVGGDPCTVACATSEGLAISNDCGKTWRTCGELPEPALSLQVVCDGDATYFIAGMTTKGLAWSQDDGRSWLPLPLTASGT
jgi:photosystem II stability/assembly factor-like uncharacterized protein